MKRKNTNEEQHKEADTFNGENQATSPTTDISTRPQNFYDFSLL